jgi:hypothetical protein
MLVPKVIPVIFPHAHRVGVQAPNALTLSVCHRVAERVTGRSRPVARRRDGLGPDERLGDRVIGAAAAVGKGREFLDRQRRDTLLSVERSQEDGMREAEVPVSFERPAGH